MKLENLKGYKVAQGIEIYDNYACMDASIVKGNIGTYYNFEYVLKFFSDINYNITDVTINEGVITRLYIEF